MTRVSGDHMKPSKMLVQAIKEKNLQLVQKLLKTNLVTIKNTDYARGWSSLFFTAINNDVNMAEFLLRKGHEDEGISRDLEGDTIPIVCVRNSAINVLKVYLKSFPQSLNLQNNQGETALMAACKLKNHTVLTVILQFSPQIHLKDKKGNTALHYAFAWGNLSSIQILLKENADPFVKNKKGFRPIDYAYSFDLQEFILDEMNSVTDLTKADSLVSI